MLLVFKVMCSYVKTMATLSTPDISLSIGIHLVYGMTLSLFDSLLLKN